MNETILTIGIPVFNGEELIEQTFESILKQINETNINKLEILFSDNASTDSTSEIIKKYQSKYPKLITYFRNDENFDADVNFSLVFKRSKGIYVWLLGCGEILTEDCIDEIIERLKNDDYDNLLLNFEIFSESLNKFETKNSFDIKEDIVFRSKDDFFQSRFYAGVTPISANIIKKKAWDSVIHIPIITSGWYHVERVIHLMARNEYQKTLIISKPCFINYREKDGWWTKTDRNYLFERSFQLLLIFQDMVNFGYQKKTINILCKRNYKDVFQNLVKWKITGEVSSKNLINKSFLHYNRLSFWIVLLPILMIPVKKFPDTIIFILKRFIKMY